MNSLMFAWMDPREQLALMLKEYAYAFQLDELLNSPFQTFAALEDELDQILMKSVKVGADLVSVHEFLKSNPNSTLVLVPYLLSETEVDEEGGLLCDLFRTFTTLAKMIFFRYKHFYYSTVYEGDTWEKQGKICLLKDAVLPRPGFRWELIVFLTESAESGKSINDLRHFSCSPHVGVLATIFFNPDLMRTCINGGKDSFKTLPVPGIELEAVLGFNSEASLLVPILYYRNRCVLEGGEKIYLNFTGCSAVDDRFVHLYPVWKDIL